MIKANNNYLSRMVKLLFLLLILLSSITGCHVDQKDSSAKQLNNPAEESSTLNADSNFKRGIVTFSTDEGLSWKPLNDGLPENTQASFIAKKNNELVLATDNQGIFITENNRTKWKNIGQGLPTPKINALQAENNDIYVGLYRQGIFKSGNNGNSWMSLNEGLPNLSVQAILKTNGNLIVGTDAGIFKTGNGLKDWKQKSSNYQVLSLNEYNGKIVAGTSTGVLFSVDSGETWKQIHNEGAIHYTAFIDNTIYAMYMSGSVFMSTDSGNTWTKFNYYPNYRAYIYQLTKIGSDLLMSNSYGLFKSTDNGKSWDNYFKEERFIFFDFLTVDNIVYGATRTADEFRNRK